MSDDTDKLTILCQERREMRDEILEMEKGVHKVVFGFFSVALAVLGLFSQRTHIQSVQYYGLAVMVLAQLEIGAVLLLAALWANMGVSAGYAAAIESRINQIMKERVTIYETIVCPRYIVSHHGALFWIGLVMLFLAAVALCIMLKVCYDSFACLAWIVTLETVVAAFLLIWSVRTVKDVRRFVEEEFRRPLDS